jgi:HlyD family secretion protein
LSLPRPTAAFWFWFAAIASVASFVFWLLWPRPMLVEAALVDRGAVQRELGEEGRVRIRDVFTVAAPLTGLVNRIELRAGDQVRKGDVVATIDPVAPALLDARAEQEAAAAVAAARSALSAAEADARLAAAEQERTATLFERGFASKAALERSQTQLSAANALVTQRKADLKRAEALVVRPSTRARPVVVRSPSSGRVLQLFQESESVVLAGSPLLEIGDPASIEITADYLSQDAALIEEGACAFVESPGGARFPARVTTVEPYAKTKVSALGVEEQRVTIVLTPEDVNAIGARLGHGYRVDVHIVMFRQEDALRAPTDALVRTPEGRWAVFRIVGDRARLVLVDAGEGDDRFRLVGEGLTPGDKVVLFPPDTLRDGDRVTPRP